MCTNKSLYLTWTREFGIFFNQIAYTDKKHVPGPHTPRSSRGLFSTPSPLLLLSQALGTLCSSLRPRRSLSGSTPLTYILVHAFLGLLLL